MNLPDITDEQLQFACSCDDFQDWKEGDSTDPRDILEYDSIEGGHVKSLIVKSERHQRCDDVLAWAYDYLSEQNDQFVRRTVTAENFLTSWCYWMDGYYSANLEAIYTDQWSVVVVRTAERRRDDFSVSIQCDQVEHGLAYALLAFVRHFGQKNESGWLNDEEWKAKKASG